MKSPVPALVLALLALVLSTPPARANAPSALDAQPDPDAPRIAVQLEIRGLAPLFDQTARLLAPFLPPTQTGALLKQALFSLCPVDLPALAGLSSTNPVRALVYAKPGASRPGIILDLPAAGGDIDAFFATVALSCTSSPVPDAVAARLPPTARLYTLPPNPRFPDPRLLFLPHGSRVAVWPLAWRGGLPPARAARLVSAFPPIDAEGVLAVRLDPDALSTLSDRLDGPLAALPGNLPRGAATAFGIGIDPASRLRIDTVLSLPPSSPYARYHASLAPPAPFLNAILAPDTLAATVQHTDRTLLDRAFADELVALLGADAGTRGIDLPPLLRDLASLLPDLATLLGNDLSAALYPPSPAHPLPWALCTSLPPGIQSPSDLADRLSALLQPLHALARRLLQTVPGADPSRLPALTLSTWSPRTVSGIPVLPCALRADPADSGTPRTLLTFDIALAGPALLLASLPDDRLAAILDALAPGAPALPGIDSLPAFASACGSLPPGASATLVRLVPLLRNLHAALLAHPAIAPGLRDWTPFLDAVSAIDLPLASLIRTGDAPSIVRETLSLPLADLHALAAAIHALLTHSPSAPPPAAPADPFADW